MISTSKIFSSFSVDDLAAARQFYEKVLGFKVKDSAMGPIHLQADGINPIVVYPKPNHQPATFTVMNFPVDDIDKAVDELTAKGVVFEKYDEPIKTDAKGICRDEKGPYIAWFKDPAGNILSVLQER